MEEKLRVPILGKLADGGELRQTFNMGWTRRKTGGTRLEEADLDRLVDQVGASKTATGFDIRAAIDRVYVTFVKQLTFERKCTGDASSTKAKSPPPKPEKAARDDLRKLARALSAFEERLNKLAPATEYWLNEYFTREGCREEAGHPLTLWELRRRLDWPVDVLAVACRDGDIKVKRGQSNKATWVMVRSLANLWDEVHGSLPVSDKGRGHRQDPFLELCQDVARLARDELKPQNLQAGPVNLTGIVPRVLIEMRDERRAQADPRDK